MGSTASTHRSQSATALSRRSSRRRFSACARDDTAGLNAAFSMSGRATDCCRPVDSRKPAVDEGLLMAVKDRRADGADRQLCGASPPANVVRPKTSGPLQATCHAHTRQTRCRPCRWPNRSCRRRTRQATLASLAVLRRANVARGNTSSLATAILADAASPLGFAFWSSHAATQLLRHRSAELLADIAHHFQGQLAVAFVRRTRQRRCYSAPGFHRSCAGSE